MDLNYNWLEMEREIMQYAMFSTTQYVIGNGSIEKIRDFKDKKIAIIIDEMIVKALKLNEKLYDDILKESDYQLICNVNTEPNMEMLEEPIHKIQEFKPECIIGIGGGSVMDAAKALWLFYELPHYDWEMAMKPYEVEKFPGKSILIAIPTTSGTGSETTGCAVIKDYQKEKKMILSNEIIPNLAIMDFDLLRSIPSKNIAFSGTDALAHALEAGTSKLASSMVKMQCIQAAVTILKELPKSYEGNLNARENVHIAATMAGVGISNSITGMAHGMDQAGGDFGKPHGLMTGLLLPYTMRYLMPQPLYEEVAEQLGIIGNSKEKQNQLIEYIWNVYDEIQMPKTLKDIGINKNEYMNKIPEYVTKAKNDANILFVPKDPTEAELEKLYYDFYEGIQEGGIKNG